MIERYKFYIFLGLLGLLSGIGQWSMLRWGFSSLEKIWTISFFLLAPLIYVIPNTLEKYLPITATKILARIGGYWFIYAFYATLLLLPFFTIWLFCLIMAAPDFRAACLGGYAQLTAILLIVLLIIGAYRALHPTVRRVTITTDKTLSQTMTIAFASDIHLGAVLGKSFSKKLVENLNQLNPDIILFGGDIIDGNLNFVLKDNSFDSFSKLTPTIGTYTVFGNHDHYGMNITLEKDILEYNGVHCLYGETATIKDYIKLIGMKDHLYHPADKIPTGSANLFSIIIDHEPVRIKEAVQAGHDLYLAGHTHAGQFWPIRHFTKKIFGFDYGTRQFNQLTAIISNGYGAWGTLFRLGPKPEIVLITIKNKS